MAGDCWPPAVSRENRPMRALKTGVEVPRGKEAARALVFQSRRRSRKPNEPIAPRGLNHAKGWACQGTARRAPAEAREALQGGQRGTSRGAPEQGGPLVFVPNRAGFQARRCASRSPAASRRPVCDRSARTDRRTKRRSPNRSSPLCADSARKRLPEIFRQEKRTAQTRRAPMRTRQPRDRSARPPPDAPPPLNAVRSADQRASLRTPRFRISAEMRT